MAPVPIPRLLQLAVLFAASVLLSGCTPWSSGSSMPYDPPTRAGLEGALSRYSLAILLEDDEAFCSMTDKKLLYEMALAYGVSDHECSEVVERLADQQRTMMKLGVRDHLSNFKIEGDYATLIQTVETGRTAVLTRLFAQRRGGHWVITDQLPLDGRGSDRPNPGWAQS